MGKRKWLASIMLLILFICAACNSGNVPVEAMGNVMQNGPAKEDKPEAEEKELVIYYSNKSADGLDTEVITVAEITPELIINKLAKHNIVSIDTRINEFDINIDKAQGRTILALDLSKAFGEYLKTMGSSGESLIISALTHTFLKAYGADAFLLSIEGAILKTQPANTR